METINVTVWTVMQGDEDSAHLRDMAVTRDRAKAVFDAAVAEIDAADERTMPHDGLHAGNGMDWVRLEPRTMTTPLGDLIRAIAEATASEE